MVQGFTEFEGFTEEARSACFRAILEAVNRGCETAKPEHFLLGLLQEDSELAERFFDVTATRAFVQEITQGRSQGAVDATLMPLDPTSERMLSFTVEEAKVAGLEKAGLEHLLLGLVRWEEESATHLLEGRRANSENIRLALRLEPYLPIPREERGRRILKYIEGLQSEAAKRPEADTASVERRFNRLDHCTEKARRSIFFARREAREFASEVVKSEHLLLGLLKEGVDQFDLYFPSGASRDTVCRQIELQFRGPDKIPGQKDPELSDECERVLARGEDEAKIVGRSKITTADLMLGLLREEDTFASRILREHGANLEYIWKHLLIVPGRV